VDFRALAERNRHLRIGGDGWKVVSLDMKNPCGRITSRDVSKRGSASEAQEDAVRHGDDDVPFAGNKKNEHRLQAYLIRRAMLDPGGLLEQLRLDALGCDSLCLITDELRLKEVTKDHDLRADLLFLVRQHGRFRPLLVELKVRHDPDDSPFKQLDNAARVLAGSADELAKLLIAAGSRCFADLSSGNLALERPLLLAVLPYRTARTRVTSFAEALGFDLGRHELRTFSKAVLAELDHEANGLSFFVDDAIRN
jgi:hypothetical protein